VYSAIIKGIEVVDSCLQSVIEAGLKKDYEFIVIADHGNADFAINGDGTPNTSHSLNPVPIIHITSSLNTSIKDGILADVAPTILSRLGIAQPTEMTGTILV
jgi:2,3-bisphosphoglycerate-independent phosphoglycerate mutase